MITQKGASGSILYFPAIELPSREWVLAQLLLWDRVQRIVPSEQTPENALIEALVKSGLVVDIPPDAYLREAESNFRTALEGLFAQGRTTPATLRERNSIATAARAFTQRVPLHNAKLSPGTRELLHDLGALTPRCDPWWKVDRSLGYLYMCSLANAMSELMHTPLVTDYPSAIDWQLCFRRHGSLDVASPVRTAFDLNISWPTPRELAGIKDNEFLDWWKSTIGPRQAFRKHLLKLHTQTASISDKNEYRAAIRSQQDSLAYHVREFRRAVDELKVQAFTGAVRIAWPSALAAGGAALSTILPHIGIPLATLGIGWALVQAEAVYRKEYRQSIASTPYSYVALLEDRFGTRTT